MHACTWMCATRNACAHAHARKHTRTHTRQGRDPWKTAPKARPKPQHSFSSFSHAKKKWRPAFDRPLPSDAAICCAMVRCFGRSWLCTDRVDWFKDMGKFSKELQQVATPRRATHVCSYARRGTARHGAARRGTARTHGTHTGQAGGELVRFGRAGMPCPHAHARGTRTHGWRGVCMHVRAQRMKKLSMKKMNNLAQKADCPLSLRVDTMHSGHS